MSIANKSIEIKNLSMAYFEEGDGPTVLLLHGNPTSSYLWRNVIPEISSEYRCIAPDLIGMGKSDKLPASGPTRYTFDDHRGYLDAFIEKVIPDGPVTLVLHDWGTALGFHWAHRFPERVAGITYFEGLVMPFSWKTWPEAAVEPFKALRSEMGEPMVLEQNAFIEQILPANILRTLSEEEMNVYRAPYLESGEARRPLLTWPRQIPIDGEPAEVFEIVRDYSRWLAESPIPKLFVNGDPGAFLVSEMRDFCRTWRNQEEVTVPGLHFLQEDSGPEIGAAVRKWMKTI